MDGCKQLRKTIAGSTKIRTWRVGYCALEQFGAETKAFGDGKCRVETLVFQAFNGSCNGKGLEKSRENFLQFRELLQYQMALTSRLLARFSS